MNEGLKSKHTATMLLSVGTARLAVGERVEVDFGALGTFEGEVAKALGAEAVVFFECDRTSTTVRVGVHHYRKLQPARRPREACGHSGQTCAGQAAAAAPAPAKKKRGRRVDKAELAELYAALHARMPQPVTQAGLSKEFSDRELRVLMKHNGMHINDYDQRTDSFNEKTKTSKCKTLAAAVSAMIVPERDAGSPTDGTVRPTQRRKSAEGEPRAQAPAGGEAELLGHVLTLVGIEEYLDRVKETFESTRPEVYSDFLDIMKAVEREETDTDTPAVINDRVSRLFQGHQDLILQFQTLVGVKTEGNTRAVPRPPAQDPPARDTRPSNRPRPPVQDPPEWLIASAGGMHNQGQQQRQQQRQQQQQVTSPVTSPVSSPAAAAATAAAARSRGGPSSSEYWTKREDDKLRSLVNGWLQRNELTAARLIRWR
jgi:hypothetical protein